VHANDVLVQVGIAPGSGPDTDLAMTTKHKTRTTRQSPTVEELRNRPLRTDRLWDIVDVATFLGYSKRLAEEAVKDPTVPQPRFVTKGGERRWAPSQWYAWADAAETTHLGHQVPLGDPAPARWGRSDG
jgi:hypothetical protein